MRNINFNEMIWKEGKFWKWNDKFVEWLRIEAENGNTPHGIKDLIGVDYKRINLIAQENCIEFKVHKNNVNQVQIYHSYDWCYQRYVVEGKNQKEIAIEANCSIRVIQKWLAEKHRLIQSNRAEIKKFNNIQHNLIIGSILGDGHIDKRDMQPNFIVSHAENQKDYLYWKYEILKDLCNKEPTYYSPRQKSFGGKVYDCQGAYRLNTRIYNSLKIYRDMTTFEILDELNEFSFVIFMLDDGHNDIRNRGGWAICMADYSKEEKDYYISICKSKFNLDCKYQKDDRYIKFDMNSTRKINEMIKRIIPNDLDIMYKVG